ncbi:hypothetical protein HB852_00010 [Listeria grandensis]|uniref:hypothetical protein n=1 Tax=Listeria grandensis TaxID=1494963 RepID=UPI001626ABB6|nr:hypothetical protein [Listeria grandensis]MBC1472998.1 hypothetical protein [Listeria grandensis]
MHLAPFQSDNGASSDPINAHITEGFRKQFSSNGATKLGISPDEIKAQADLIKSVAADIDRMIRLLEDFRGFENDAVKKMIHKANNETYGGEYDLLNENDVDNIVHDLAVSRTEGVYRFHDEEILHDLINKLLEDSITFSNLHTKSEQLASTCCRHISILATT